MIGVHLQIPLDNFKTLQGDISHYISQTVPQKKFLNSASIMVFCAF